jgi:DNA-directed RNA polymerase subunit RPC12/RpoP
MTSSSYFGYKCPRCHATVDIGAMVGAAKPTCPSCGAIMEPDPKGKTSAGNVQCSKCHSSFGLVNSDKCPICDEPFT